MIKINTEELNAKQVNDIILLVNDNEGSIYATQKGNQLKLDLSRLRFAKKVKVLRRLRQIKKGESST